MFSILIICIGYSITDDPVIACRYDKKKNKIGDYTVDRQSVSIDNNIISCKIINYYSNYFIIKVEDYINNTFKFVDYVVDKNVIKPNLKNYIYNPIQLTTSSQNKYPYFISDMDSNKFMEKNNYVYFQSKINIKNYVNIYTLDDSSPYISNNTKVRIEFIYNSILTIDIEDNVIGIKGTVNNETNNQTIIIYKNPLMEFSLKCMVLKIKQTILFYKFISNEIHKCLFQIIYKTYLSFNQLTIHCINQLNGYYVCCCNPFL